MYVCLWYRKIFNIVFSRLSLKGLTSLKSSNNRVFSREVRLFEFLMTFEIFNVFVF